MTEEAINDVWHPLEEAINDVWRVLEEALFDEAVGRFGLKVVGWSESQCEMLRLRDGMLLRSLDVTMSNLPF